MPAQQVARPNILCKPKSGESHWRYAWGAPYYFEMASQGAAWHCISNACLTSDHLQVQCSGRLTSGSKLNHLTSWSPGCSSRTLKLTVRASTRAGVPVLRRSVSNPRATSASVSPGEGASPALHDHQIVEAGLTSRNTAWEKPARKTLPI